VEEGDAEQRRLIAPARVLKRRVEASGRHVLEHVAAGSNNLRASLGCPGSPVACACVKLRLAAHQRLVRGAHEARTLLLHRAAGREKREAVRGHAPRRILARCLQQRLLEAQLAQLPRLLDQPRSLVRRAAEQPPSGSQAVDVSLIRDCGSEVVAQEVVHTARRPPGDALREARRVRAPDGAASHVAAVVQRALRPVVRRGGLAGVVQVRIPNAAALEGKRSREKD